VKDVIDCVRSFPKDRALWRWIFFASHPVFHRPLCWHLVLRRTHNLLQFQKQRSHPSRRCQFSTPFAVCWCYRNAMLLLLYFPFTATLLEVILALLGEEEPFLIRLPSRSSCHFLFSSCLLPSSRQPLCFFFPFLPQSFCSLPARVKPAVSFPHLPPFSRMTSSDVFPCSLHVCF